jgi:hypothetical protein
VASARPTISSEDLRDAEVDDLDVRSAVVAPRAEEVRRLEIAMHDAVGVRVVERLAYLQHTIDRVLYRQRAGLLERACEVLALEVLHHHEGRAVVERADIEYENDVLARDLPDGARLAFEAETDLVRRERGA